jgi:hypothetical protein
MSMLAGPAPDGRLDSAQGGPIRRKLAPSALRRICAEIPSAIAN